MNNYHFEDLEIGMSHSFTVTITEKMMNSFFEISGDDNPLHVDGDFAKSQNYQDRVVYGLLTTSFISKLVGVYLPGKYCLLQGIDLKYVKPVYINDILTVSGSISELHESVKRMSLIVEIFNQDNKKVVKGKVEVGFLNY